ncbi:MAG: protein translocase subunit SecD [Gammaproteobacteria bacterium]|nr:protein translocase subunit SecD [Gammaproteobacteria bacterium]
MLNHYPAWKNLLILLVMVLGILYSVPNLYPDDEALQVTHESRELGQTDLDRITTALEAARLATIGEELNGSGILLRFDGVEEQLRAKTAIEDALSDDFIVALNLAPTTPGWMQAIGAGKMNLGLDLQGGVHFLMEVDMEAAVLGRMEDNLSNVRSILRELRIRSRGLALVDSSHIEVRFASADDRSRARSELLDNFPELQFQNREANDLYILDLRMTQDTMLQIQRDTLQANRTTLLNRVDALGVAEPTVQQQGANRIVVELPGVQDPAQAIRILQRIATLEFHLEAAPGAPRSSYQTYDYVTPEGAFTVNVDNDVILQGDRISNVRPSLDQNGLPQVQISLDAQGGNQINRVTRDNVGRMMDILLIETRSRTNLVIDENGEEVEAVEFFEDRRLISHARINSALGRQFVITGLTQREAMDLSLLISSGSLAAPMTIVEQSVIGPTMGRENLEQGIRGVQIAAILVVAFMLLYYRIFGIAANVALIMNIVLIFAVLSSVLPATLTLPGIVGIVLTVGMAVDANVLIFTRIKEELRNGLPPQQAISAGYDRAFTTILDANLTTFLVAVVLFTIGTGPVKGFAVTLMIGIVTSMFTAIVGTRALVNLIYGRRRELRSLSIGIVPVKATPLKPTPGKGQAV